MRLLACWIVENGRIRNERRGLAFDPSVHSTDSSSEICWACDRDGTALLRTLGDFVGASMSKLTLPQIWMVRPTLERRGCHMKMTSFWSRRPIDFGLINSSAAHFLFLF